MTVTIPRRSASERHLKTDRQIVMRAVQVARRATRCSIDDSARHRTASTAAAARCRGALASSRGKWSRRISATAVQESPMQDASPKDAPLRSLFPDEPSPPSPNSPKLKVAIIGAGLAGLSTAVELLDQGSFLALSLRRVTPSVSDMRWRSSKAGNGLGASWHPSWTRMAITSRYPDDVGILPVRSLME